MSRDSFLILILILIFAATAYIWYSYPRSSPPVAEAIPADELTVRLEELRRLKTIKLDTSIFEDRFFQSLVLPKAPVQPEVKVGRPNPFLPFR